MSNTNDAKVKEIKKNIKVLLNTVVKPENRPAYNEALQAEYTKLMVVISEAV